MNIITALNWRYAVRRFAEQRLDPQQVDELLTATRLSATSYGLQPYRMILVDNKQIREALVEHAYGQDKVLHCSHLLVFAAQTDIGDAMIDRYLESVAKIRKQTPASLLGLAQHMKGVFRDMSHEQKRNWAHQQVHIALGTLLSAAALMRIDACPMGGIEAPAFDRILGLREQGLETSVICALGIRHADDDNALLPKVRYGKQDMVMVI